MGCVVYDVVYVVYCNEWTIFANALHFRVFQRKWRLGGGRGAISPSPYGFGILAFFVWLVSSVMYGNDDNTPTQWRRHGGGGGGGRGQMPPLWLFLYFFWVVSSSGRSWPWYSTRPRTTFQCEYLWIFVNIPKYSRILWNESKIIAIPLYSRVFQNIRRMLQNILKYSNIFKNTQKYMWIFVNICEYSGIIGKLSSRAVMMIVPLPQLWFFWWKMCQGAPPPPPPTERLFQGWRKILWLAQQSARHLVNFAPPLSNHPGAAPAPTHYGNNFLPQKKFGLKKCVRVHPPPLPRWLSFSGLAQCSARHFARIVEVVVSITSLVYALAPLIVDVLSIFLRV